MPQNNALTLVVREYDDIDGLSPGETRALKEFALNNQTDANDNYRPVLRIHRGKIRAQNYVGVIQTHKGKQIEILPKVDPFGEDEHVKIRKVFLEMLQTWPGLHYAQFNAGRIGDLERFNMLEAFIRIFLENLVLLARRGLAKHYQPVEENLPRLKGRILFPQHIRLNAANRARFYVRYDEFNANRPANRLIHSALEKLRGIVRHAKNRQLLHQMKICFSEIPLSTNQADDWNKHQIDRSMQHYDAVMQWVGLFLFNRGLTTFSGKHMNACLLFPMEEIFESFVTHHFRQYARKPSHGGYQVWAQGPRKPLAHFGHSDGKPAFHMKPDISLYRPEKEKLKFLILDTKWKEIDQNAGDIKHGIQQADMYQLYAYGKKYNEVEHDGKKCTCEKVALIYPENKNFDKPFDYKLDSGLTLSCHPFNVDKPQQSVGEIVTYLDPQLKTQAA